MKAISALANAYVASPRGFYLAAFAIGLAALSVAHQQDTEGVAQLERLAPKIEHAHVLSPATREAISILVARQGSLIGAGDPAWDSRRKLAIDRITQALNANNAAASNIAAAD